MNIDYHTVCAFTKNERGGNFAGVVLDADRLTHSQKQAIAHAAGLSETAFISQSAIADFKLEFFTPTRQIAHCGHATIATFSLLKELGCVENGPTSKETIDGKRAIFIENDEIFMEQKAPIYREIFGTDEKRIPVALGLTTNELNRHMKPVIIDTGSALDLSGRANLTSGHTGNAFLIVPIRDRWALQDIQPDLPAIRQLSIKYGLIGFYAFVQSQDPEYHATTRMFAPAYGIAEEAATGMAAGPLACFLHDQMKIQKTSINIAQGYFMPKPSPSLIQVKLEIEDQAIQRLLVGGKAKVMKTHSVKVTPQCEASFITPSLG
jgi:predicted PhzF superfamily epimerase YddE/YHI9